MVLSRPTNNNNLTETMGSSSGASGSGVGNVTSSSSARSNRRRRTEEIIRCSLCGTTHKKSFWYRHILSQVHKNAVYEGSSQNIPRTRGVILHQGHGMMVYDILFKVESNNINFFQPELESVEQASLEETLQGAKDTIEMFFAHFYEGIIYRLEEGLALHNSIKVHCSLSLRMQKFTAEGQILYDNISLRTAANEILVGTNLREWTALLLAEMLVKYEENSHRGSNWSLLKVNDFELHISQFSPLRASSFIPLPSEITRKRATINVRNFHDEFCFKYSILAKILHATVPRNSNLNRVNHYKKEEYDNVFNFENIRFPTPISDIKIFEKNNLVSVNVYGLSNEGRKETFVYPIRISKNYIKDKHFNLLYIQDEASLPRDIEPVNGHYCYITDLSRLVNAQNNNHEHRLHICHRCLLGFNSETTLFEHERFCMKYESIRSEMPTGENTIQKFKNFRFKERIPYIIYADFECALIPYSTASRELNIEGAFTEKTHIHLPTSYCYYIVCSNEADETDYKPQLYRGPNAVQHFWKSIRSDLEKIGAVYEYIVPMNITPEDEDRLREEVQCHICGAIPEPSQNEEIIQVDFVIDHCHLTGKVRGWACYACNINYKLPSFVPIVLHNGSNYDFKMIIREVYSEIHSDNDDENENRRRPARNNRDGRSKRARCNFILDEAEDSDADEDEDDEDEDDDHEDDDHEDFNEGRGIRTTVKNSGEIKVIAKNVENFISFEVKINKKLSARFIDSFRFMSSGLSTLANNLNSSQLSNISKFYQGNLFELVKRKGVFPYEYITSFDQYDEQQLPPIEAFYSTLTGEGILDEDYNHAQLVFQSFNCQTLGQYSDIYLKTDVLLLADVFENFRDLCLQIYNLDAAWHYSAPGLAWNAMLKVTQVELELLTDYTMFMFYEASIRGGYCSANERYVKSNNPGIVNYNPNDQQNYLFYIDANNLYGYAMSEPLPLHSFEWLEQQEMDSLDILSISEDSLIGYILEVDLEYPHELHVNHNDYPYCPEQLRTTSNKNIPHKLIATLHDKYNYIVHYRYLQSALKQGLKLKKIHRGVKFYQERWMQLYINLNNEKRKVATTEFAKDYHKLMNNACFGKFLESIRKRRSFILTNKKSTILRNIRMPTFKRRIILNEKTNLVLIERARTNLFFDKFIQAGGAILDISKTHMYDFHYNIMKSEIFLNSHISLAYTDTDSFIYNIKIDSTLTLTDYLHPYKSYFDFSDYPSDHPLFDISNKKVLGKMKDELTGRHMSEFCALKAKMYSYKVHDNHEVKKAKGIKKNVIKKSLNFEHYHNCLVNSGRVYRTVTSIRSFAQQLFTIQQNKVALTMMDDKRFILPDGIHTLAWGHKDIPLEDDIIYQYNITSSDIEDEDDESMVE